MLQREREREERGEGWQPLTPLCYYLSLSLLSPPSFFPHSLLHFNSAPLNISLFLCTLSLVFFLFSLIGLFYYSSSSCFCSLSSFPSHHYSWQHVFPTKFSQSSSFFLVTTLLHQPLTCILFISGWIQDFSTLVELQIYWENEVHPAESDDRRIAVWSLTLAASVPKCPWAKIPNPSEA